MSVYKTFHIMLTEMLTEMLAFARELQDLFDLGYNLREISHYSYIAREAGRNVPYMSILQTQDGVVVDLVASPSARQKALCGFFAEIAPNRRVLPRFSLVVNEAGVQFRERSTAGEILLKF